MLCSPPGMREENRARHGARAIRALVGVAVVFCMHALVVPAFADELIVDDADPAVQLSGSWQMSATTPGFYGGGYLFHTPDHGVATVRWPFPASGSAAQYRVYARWSSGANRATAALYEVASTKGISQLRVSQKTGGQWHLLGTFGLESGPTTAAFGFSSADPMQVIHEETGSVHVGAQHAGKTYDIHLIQPSRLGSSGIWVVTSVQLAGSVAAP
jgi:hypothetical protein